MSTIFTPQNLSPRNEVRDMLLPQLFTATIDGVRCTDYQIRIYKVSDNALVHNTNKINLTTPLANGQVLSHTVAGGTITNTGTDSYKWTLQVWDASNTVTSREVQFFAKTTPVLTFNPPTTINEQSYDFTATLTQAQGDLVNTYEFELYDSTQTLIESSGQITNFNIFHEFEGFVNGDELYVRVFGQTTGRQNFNSGLVAFDVSYSQPSVNLKPEVEVNNESSLLTVTRSDVVQIIGTGSGTFGYVNNFLYTGNTALTLGTPSSYVDFDVNIPLDFTLSFKWQPSDNLFTGKIIQLDNGAYEVGYDLGAFYYTINGVTQFSPPIDLYGSVFYIVLQPQTCTFVRKQLFNQWTSLPLGSVWNDFSGDTWEDIGLIQ
jgi:hypothetical protein